MTPRVHPCAGLLAISAKLISGAQARWYNCRPEFRQRIYFANHSSHLDMLVLWAALPWEVRSVSRPVAAKEYWSRSKPRQYIAGEIFRAVMIDRPENAIAAPGTLAPLLRALEEGSSLILFPEGRRGNGEAIAPFKAGLYHLCSARPDLEAVPVCLENLNRVLPKGAVIPMPLMSRVTFGPPLLVDPTESKDSFLSRARAALCELRDV